MKMDDKLEIPGYCKVDLDLNAGRMIISVSLVPTEEEYLIFKKELDDVMNANFEFMKRFIENVNDRFEVGKYQGSDPNVA